MSRPERTKVFPAFLATLLWAAGASADSMDSFARVCLATSRGFPLYPLGRAEPPRACVPDWPPARVLGTEVPPGSKVELFLRSSESFAGSSVRVPVVTVRGWHPGPTLCLTAGIHGDELNGIEVVRKFAEELEPEHLAGMVLAVPIVNLHGFQRSSRYLPDRRDLNRYFPGHPLGSSASRIAHALFEGVVRHCDALVDFHSGSFHRTNLPQIRADLRHAAVRRLARGFGCPIVLHNVGREGTLRRAATERGIPAIVYEAGEPMRFQREEIDRGVEGVRRLLGWLGMTDFGGSWSPEPRFYPESHWVRVDMGGILVAEAELGDTVESGTVLGVVTDPIRKERSVVVSPYDGTVIGMTLAPVVIPGYAAFHIGVPDGVVPETAPGAFGSDVGSEGEEERPE